MGKSGMNKREWLADMGVGAGKSDLLKVVIDALYLHPEGHPLRHPRVGEPLEEALVLDIMERGIVDAVLVRTEHDAKGNEVLALCDGCRRDEHGLEAQTRLRKKKDTRILKEINGKWCLPVPVKFLPGDCTDADFLLARQSADANPLKKPHSVSVLAGSIVQMCKLEVDPKRILSVLPKGWTLAHIEAISKYWHSMTPALRARFDASTDPVPVGLLPAVLNTAPAGREAILDELLAAGRHSVATATRFLNAKARAEAEAEDEESEAPPFDEDGLDAVPPSQEPPTPAADTSKKKTSAPKPKKATAKEAVKGSLHQSVNKKTVERFVAHSTDKPKRSHEEAAFCLGAQTAIDPNEYKPLLKMAESLGSQAQHLLAGLLWRHGYFGAGVQALVIPDVLATLAETVDKKAKQGDKKRAAKTK